jgi:hypothetical protein
MAIPCLTNRQAAVGIQIERQALLRELYKPTLKSNTDEAHGYFGNEKI